MAREARAQADLSAADTDGAGEIAFSRPACRAGAVEEFCTSSFFRMDTTAMRRIIPGPKAPETNSIISGRKLSFSRKVLDRYRAGSVSSKMPRKRKQTKG